MAAKGLLLLSWQHSIQGIVLGVGAEMMETKLKFNKILTFNKIKILSLNI